MVNGVWTLTLVLSDSLLFILLHFYVTTDTVFVLSCTWGHVLRTLLVFMCT